MAGSASGKELASAAAILLSPSRQDELQKSSQTAEILSAETAVATPTPPRSLGTASSLAQHPHGFPLPTPKWSQHLGDVHPHAAGCKEAEATRGLFLICPPHPPQALTALGEWMEGLQ